jgi:hypothetical protein
MGEMKSGSGDSSGSVYAIIAITAIVPLVGELT